MKQIKIFSPATVANVACGFDILGLALQTVGDELEVSLVDSSEITLENLTPYYMPLEPKSNTVSVAMQAYLKHIGSHQGFRIRILKKIKPGSGLGSSAASSAAGVFAANYLLGNLLPKRELVRFAMEGERVACGSAHADNVGPALLGGFVLIRSYHPLDIVQLPWPADLHVAVVHPQIELKTEDARRVLRKEVQLKDAVVQWGNTAGLVAGLFQSDFALIGRSLVDVIIEPTRSLLIPGYAQVKEAAVTNGALGCSISGSGPSIFSLCQSLATAQQVAQAMNAVFINYDIETDVHVSPINPEGIRVLSEN